MDPSGYVLETLREDASFVLYRAQKPGKAASVMMLTPASSEPDLATLRRLEHEYALSEDIDDAWAAKPLALTRHEGRTVLMLSDHGCWPLDRWLGKPFNLAQFLNIAIGLVTALRQVHERCLIHKDIKPANVLVDDTGNVRLTGFGLATRLARERPPSSPPELIAGTLAYMAPEQTGRMNRSIDTRSDLYALGVTLYEFLTGVLPFAASDPMEWIHCHIARQPPAPSTQVEGIPPQLDAIILKLLAKTGEERYQTAAGVEHDLRRCLMAWQAGGRIDAFPLATRDRSDRLLIPEKLYGRVAESDALLCAFDRVAGHGVTGFVLVSGEAGSGKTSFVNELQKKMTLSRGILAAGKADRHKSGIPYATLAQAVQGLVRRVLGEGAETWNRWRLALLGALGPNAQLMFALAPELSHVIGEQAPVPELSPHDEKRRFQWVLKRFLGVFAQPEHPLTLFLDDVQWLDTATLDLLERLVLDQDVKHLLVIGTYRQNEVDGLHPLCRTLETVHQAVTRIAIGPLAVEDLRQLVADALHCDADLSARLARLVLEKTGGNPFFVAQLLTALVDEGLLAFDPDLAAWQWDVDRTRAKAISDNVADHLAERLNRLSRATLEAVKQFACLGDKTQIATLAIMLETDEQQAQAVLWEAVNEGLVSYSDGTFAFAHDRIREAAYALVTEAERPVEHLRIGRAIWSSLPPGELEENIFEITTHLQRGAILIQAPEERIQVAELHLAAGKRARASAAYASALPYLVAGSALLPESRWDHHYRLAFDLEFLQAECEFLLGDLNAAEARLLVLQRHARDLVDAAAVICSQVSLYTAIGEVDRAMEVGLDYLHGAGIALKPNPSDLDVRKECERVWTLLEARPIEHLRDLPLVGNERWRACMDVVVELMTPTGLRNRNLADLCSLLMVDLSLKHGHCAGSCYAYASLALLPERGVGDLGAILHLARLGCDLAERPGLGRFKARAHLRLGIIFWGQQLRVARVQLSRAFDVANAIGDRAYAMYSFRNLTMNLLVSGEPLEVVQREAENGLTQALKAGFSEVADDFFWQLILIWDLRGRPLNHASLENPECAGEWLEGRLKTHMNMPEGWVTFWIRKLQIHFFTRNIAAGVEAAVNASTNLWPISPYLDFSEYHFYGALVRAAACDEAPEDQRRTHLEALRAHHQRIADWAERSPDNFAAREAMVAAEIARVEVRDLEAQRLYEEAIRTARAQNLVHEEGIANELAARFHAGRGLQTIASAYLRNARACYLRWGAAGKVRQLDQLYPQLRDEPILPTELITSGTQLQHLDLAAVIEMSQAVSGEIVLDRLIERLMVMVVEHAGAVRGLLLLPQGEEMSIAAEASTKNQAVAVNLEHQPNVADKLPESVLNYVTRTQDVVILEDALNADLYSADAYILEMQPRSVLCLPLVKQKRLVGVLYLENDLSPHVFTQDRLAVLRLLASQAAISIENASLFLDVQKAHEQARRAADDLRRSFDMIPALAWSTFPDGRFEFANKQWHDYTGISHEAAVSGAWLYTFHSDDIGKVANKWHEFYATGVAGEVEARIRRADGESRTFLVRATPLRDDKGNIVKWYGTNTDIDDLKRAEEAQNALARVARLTAMGELTVSIAHEVNQPLMAIVTNAATCLQWLSDQQLNIPEARQAAARIVRDGHHAGDIIASIRALARKSLPEMVELDLNRLIQEVLMLTRSELHRRGIVVETDLMTDTGSALGDRVQMQQVILNLIMNGIEAIGAIEGHSRLLRIRSRRGGSGYIEVTVSDTGTGLDPANSEKIFEAFFTTKPEGIGMGLSICRSIVEAHGGRLWASPNQPNGSVFHFTVPTFADEHSIANSD